MAKRLDEREKQVLYAFAPGEALRDGVPRLTVFIPQGAWERMRGGQGVEVDLATANIPLKIVVGRCRDHADGMRLLESISGGPLKGADQ